MNEQALTKLELEIMKVVWELGRATSREVYEALQKTRPLAYTTINTMLKILEQKQFLRKWQEERAYVYEPTQPKELVLRSMIDDFVQRVFNGAAAPLLVQLVRDRGLSEKELREIIRMAKEEP